MIIVLIVFVMQIFPLIHNTHLQLPKPMSHLEHLIPMRAVVNVSFFFRYVIASGRVLVLSIKTI